MFNLLNFFRGGSDRSVAATVPHKPTPSSEHQDTVVYVWSTSAKSVGHVALQVGKDYVSLHPGDASAYGPASFLPLKASFAQSVKEDSEIEGYSQSRRVVTEFDSAPPVQDDKPTSPVFPDKTFTIKGLNTPAMQEAFARKKEEVDADTLAYQLLPKVNVLKFFQESAHQMGGDFADAAMRTDPSAVSHTTPQTENCATIAAKVLTVGGLTIEESAMPWGVSPNGLANQLESLIAVSTPTDDEREKETDIEKSKDDDTAYLLMSCF